MDCRQKVNKGEVHYRMRCDEVADYLEKNDESDMFHRRKVGQKCPKCYTNVVKIDGCNSVHCHCGHSFTYGK